jgi:hypothetical protein
MSPGGHLVTTVAACAATAYATGSAPLTVAVAAGGFLIDVDHAVDYVLFERRRDLRPQAFLRYFIEGRMRRAVLILHSYELFALLGALAWWTEAPLISAYLLGALMHLALDIVFNGRITPHSIVAFYSFAYRLSRRFDARVLLGITPRAKGRRFWEEFFGGSRGLSALPVERAAPARRRAPRP